METWCAGVVAFCAVHAVGQIGPHTGGASVVVTGLVPSPHCLSHSSSLVCRCFKHLAQQSTILLLVCWPGTPSLQRWTEKLRVKHGVVS